MAAKLFIQKNSVLFWKGFGIIVCIFCCSGMPRLKSFPFSKISLTNNFNFSKPFNFLYT